MKSLIQGLMLTYSNPFKLFIFYDIFRAPSALYFSVCFFSAFLRHRDAISHVRGINNGVVFILTPFMTNDCYFVLFYFILFTSASLKLYSAVPLEQW